VKTSPDTYFQARRQDGAVGLAARGFHRYFFAGLFIAIGALGIFEAIIADLQNRDGVFIGGYITGINLLTFMGLLIACMGFGAFLIIQSRI
jgi:hypothetical protein